MYAGMWHSGAVVDGAVLVWGKGTSGRLGLGDDASSFQPSEVPLPGESPVLLLCHCIVVLFPATVGPLIIVALLTVYWYLGTQRKCL